MKRYIFMLLLITACFAPACAMADVQYADSSMASSVQENGSAEQNAFLFSGNLDGYMAFIEEESSIIRYALEHEALTQADMNTKSFALYELWDDAMNVLLGELENKLSPDEFAKIQDEQRVWLAEKEKAVEEAGSTFSGGSLYPLVINSEAAQITQERAYALYDMLTQIN